MDKKTTTTTIISKVDKLVQTINDNSKPKVLQVNGSLEQARDSLIQLIVNRFPNLNPRVSILTYENEEIKKEFSVKTEFDINEDVINVRFTISLMVPLLSERDISPAISEEQFWNFVSQIYEQRVFANFVFENISNAGAIQHDSGKGIIYSLILNGKIDLILKEC